MYNIFNLIKQTQQLKDPFFCFKERVKRVYIGLVNVGWKCAL
jgi:hypothetical protein